jgi:hypothetical protein
MSVVAKPMIWPNLTMALPALTGTMVYLCPFGTRFKSLTPSAVTVPTSRLASATPTLSAELRISVRAAGLVMTSDMGTGFLWGLG